MHGMDTVVSVLKREDIAPPTFRDVGAAFIVTVFGRQIDVPESSPFVQLNDAKRTIVGIFRMRGEVFREDWRMVPDE